MGLSGCLLTFVPAWSFSWNYVLQIYIISSRFSGGSLVGSFPKPIKLLPQDAQQIGLAWFDI